MKKGAYRTVAGLFVVTITMPEDIRSLLESTSKMIDEFAKREISWVNADCHAALSALVAKCLEVENKMDDIRRVGFRWKLPTNVVRWSWRRFEHELGDWALLDEDDDDLPAYASACDLAEIEYLHMIRLYAVTNGIRWIQP